LTHKFGAFRQVAATVRQLSELGKNGEKFLGEMIKSAKKVFNKFGELLQGDPKMPEMQV
jgi:hypothetical protein